MPGLRPIFWRICFERNADGATRSKLSIATEESHDQEAFQASPCEVPAEEILEPIGMGQNALARALAVPPCRTNEIVLVSAPSRSLGHQHQHSLCGDETAGSAAHGDETAGGGCRVCRMQLDGNCADCSMVLRDRVNPASVPSRLYSSIEPVRQIRWSSQCAYQAQLGIRRSHTTLAPARQRRT